MINFQNLFEDKNKNDIPDILEANGQNGSVFSNVQYIVDGKSYKSPDEMPPEARRKYEENAKNFNNMPPINVGSFFPFNNLVMNRAEPVFSWTAPVIIIFIGGFFSRFAVPFNPLPISDENFILLFTGISLAMAALSLVAPIIWFRRKAVLVRGRVISIFKYGSRKGNFYKPIIEFSTLQGEKVQTSTWLNSAFKLYKEGQELDLYYSPDNPHTTLIRNFISQWLLASLFGGIGVLFCAYALFGAHINPSISDWINRFWPNQAGISEPANQVPKQVETSPARQLKQTSR